MGSDYIFIYGFGSILTVLAILFVAFFAGRTVGAVGKALRSTKPAVASMSIANRQSLFGWRVSR